MFEERKEELRNAVYTFSIVLGGISVGFVSSIFMDFLRTVM